MNASEDSRNPSDDPLWDPTLPADPQLQHWQSLLAPYAASRRALLLRPPMLRPRIRPTRRRMVVGLATAATLLIALWSAHAYRLYWPEDQPWRLQQAAGTSLLVPGQRLQTGTDEIAELQVARIGRVQIAPGTALQLLGSRSGRHRIELEHGRIQARIWAPPGHFAVSSGSMRVVDLGCEFILERGLDGSGHLSVLSGWVQQHLGGKEQLVPAGHALSFSADAASTPLRSDAPEALRTALAALDHAMQRRAAADEIDALAAAVAHAARDSDQYTLMSLLLRDPELAASALYPRLARALRVSADDAAHRSDWIQGDYAAVEIWWQRLPSQPKRWWTHWRDAF